MLAADLCPFLVQSCNQLVVGNLAQRIQLSDADTTVLRTDLG